MVSILDGCTEGCGWAAAILAALSWGTFGVPLKCNVNVEVNFFVMQSYKTLVCFATCWLVLLLGEPIQWSYWGIVSGLFWVPGAACGIYGIRNAGVAVAVGTWASIQVVSSCIFGIIIFQEKVKDVQQTMFAFVILMCGLVGMSRYSEDQPSGKEKDFQRLDSTDSADSITEYDLNLSTTIPENTPKKRERKSAKAKTTDPLIAEDATSVTSATSKSKKDSTATAVAVPLSPSSGGLSLTSKIIPMEIEEGGNLDMDKPLLSSSDHNSKGAQKIERFFFLGGRVVLTRRQMGIAGAVVNGAWGGLNLIPLHYAQRDQGLSGAAYLISYATGSLIVCASIWLCLFLIHYRRKEYNFEEALACLPAWHVSELGLPGLYAGLFYSLGNFCSILAVAYLGQGVGFSFCQGQLLISGLWGVFYFKEIQGRETIMKWFASAVLTIIGIICLSYQHEGGAVHR